ncbi:MAG: hypothetical protein ACE5M4_03865 [Anaerolineales bacterium]
MSFRRLVPLVAILAVFTMALRFSIGPDTYWHLRVGDWILSEGSLPKADPFSLTRLGSEWIYPGWLAQIALIAVYQLLGFPGLNLLTALAVVAAFGFVWMTMRGEPLLRAFVLLFAATASAVYWSARPHIFTLVFTAGTLWAMARFRRDGSRVIWLLPVMMVVWANVHGGFVIPILLIGLEILATLRDLLLPKLRIAIQGKGRTLELEGGGAPLADGGRTSEASGKEVQRAPTIGKAIDEGVHKSGARQDPKVARLKTLVGVGLVGVAAIVVNPFGVDMLTYPFRTVSIGVLRDHIQEWQSPNFHQLEVQPFLWLLLLVLAAMASSPKRPTSIELIHVGVFAYLGFLAARNIALFALVAAPVLSNHLDAILVHWLPHRISGQELPSRLTRPLNAILLVLIALAALAKGALPLSNKFNEETIAESMPARAVEYLRVNHPEGPLLNSYNWGGYVLWSLYPEYLSFVDGRTDLFDDVILEEYLDVWRGKDGWQASLDQWGIQTVLIETDAPLSRELLREGWTAVHEDDQASVFTGPN